MPVADLAKGLWIHVRAGLSRVKERHQHDEEHHVPGQGTKNESAGPIEKLARVTMRISPVVVASAPASTRRPAVNGRLSSCTWRFALDLRRDGRKDGRHSSPCEEEITPTFNWTHPKSEEWARE